MRGGGRGYMELLRGGLVLGMCFPILWGCFGGLCGSWRSFVGCGEAPAGFFRLYQALPSFAELQGLSELHQASPSLFKLRQALPGFACLIIEPMADLERQIFQYRRIERRSAPDILNITTSNPTNTTSLPQDGLPLPLPPPAPPAPPLPPQSPKISWTRRISASKKRRESSKQIGISQASVGLKMALPSRAP